MATQWLKSRLRKLITPVLSQGTSLQPAGGFTLLELLIVAVISSMIISALLSLVTQLLETDQRENIRNEVQREMQMALNYIVSDLREAVYIYDNSANAFSTTAIPAFTAGFGGPTFFTGSTYAPGATPVLAFWKPEFIPNANIPSNCAGAGPVNSTECLNLQLQRRAYSLVVYLQVPRPTPNTTVWKGRSRIIRYQFSKFANLDAAIATRFTWNTGFVDPSTVSTTPIFPTWPFLTDGTNCQTDATRCGMAGTTGSQAGNPPALDAANAPVLVDYVDRPNNPNPPDQVICPDAPGVTNDYLRVPSNATNFNSFYACVRNEQDQVGISQDVLVYLRGNAAGRGGLNNDADVFTPTMYTRVTMRGIIDKVPQ